MPEPKYGLLQTNKLDYWQEKSVLCETDLHDALEESELQPDEWKFVLLYVHGIDFSHYHYLTRLM